LQLINKCFCLVKSVKMEDDKDSSDFDSSTAETDSISSTTDTNLAVASISITHSYHYSDNYHVGIMDNQIVFVKIKSSRYDFSLQKEYESGMVLNQIEHPHLLKTISLVTVDTNSFPDVRSLSFPRQALVTEYIATPVLSDIIHQLHLPALLDIFMQLCYVVHDVNHKTGMYHRDLHTGNIIIQGLSSPAVYYASSEPVTCIDDVSNVTDDSTSPLTTNTDLVSNTLLSPTVAFHTNYHCVIYDFGRTVFYDRGRLKSIVSDLKRLTRTLFQKSFYRHGQSLRYLLNSWLSQHQENGADNSWSLAQFLQLVVANYGLVPGAIQSSSSFSNSSSTSSSATAYIPCTATSSISQSL